MTARTHAPRTSCRAGCCLAGRDHGGTRQWRSERHCPCLWMEYLPPLRSDRTTPAACVGHQSRPDAGRIQTRHGSPVPLGRFAGDVCRRPSRALHDAYVRTMRLVPDDTIHAGGLPGRCAQHMQERHSLRTGSSPADMSRPAEIRQLIADAQRLLGPVDVLLDSAGIRHGPPPNSLLRNDGTRSWQSTYGLHSTRPRPCCLT